MVSLSESDEILLLVVTSTADACATALALGLFAPPLQIPRSNTAPVTLHPFVVIWERARTRAWQPVVVLFLKFFTSHGAIASVKLAFGAADTHV